MNLTFHQATADVEVALSSIHFFEPREYGDVTYGARLVTDHGILEIDESFTVVEHLIAMAISLNRQAVFSLETLLQYQR